MAVMAEEFVPSRKSWAVPGAFPAEAPGLPQYEYGFGGDDQAQDPDYTGKHSETSDDEKVKLKSTREEEAIGPEEKEWFQWLQRLAELEAQPACKADPEPVRKPPVVYYKVLTKRQREMMDDAEVLDILERGELLCCG